MPHRFEVDGLTACHAEGADTLRQQTRHRQAAQGIRSISRGAGEQLERERLQGITRQDGGGFVEGAVAGGSPPTQIIVIHRRQIVVHQAVHMDQLDRGGWIVERFRGGAERRAGRVDQRRTQAFAAAEHAVAHGFA